MRRISHVEQLLLLRKHRLAYLIVFKKVVEVAIKMLGEWGKENSPLDSFLVNITVAGEENKSKGERK